MDLYNKNWTSGSHKQFKFKEIVELITKYSSRNNTIFVGSDSFASKHKICFVTAVCLVEKSRPARYFFYKEFIPLKKYSTLATRITEEARRSIEVAEHFTERCNIAPQDIELHLDVSPFGTNNGTSRFSEMLKGYVQGYGFECRLKPNAWASQSVADRHSK